MDLASIGGLSGLVAIVIVVAKEVYLLVNHTRCRSRCCDWVGIVSIDMEKTTPPPETALIS